MPQALFTPGKDPIPIVQEAGWTKQGDWKKINKTNRKVEF
jgi:hypothetical protein